MNWKEYRRKDPWLNYRCSSACDWWERGKQLKCC